MSEIFLLSSTAVILLSLLVVALGSSRFGRGSSSSSQPSLRYRFLFGSRNTFLAGVGNAASILSLSVLFGVLLPAISGWGLSPLLGVSLGILSGVSAVALFLRSRRALKLYNNVGISFPRTLVDASDSQSRHIVRYSSLALYFILLVVELALLREIAVILAEFTRLEASAAVFIIALLVSMYSALGGFRGVLRTDLFQVTLYLAGLCFCLLWGRVSAPKSPGITIEIDWVYSASCFILSFFFVVGMPDFWVRNIGTLRTQDVKKLTSVKVGLAGLMLVSLPMLLVPLVGVAPGGLAVFATSISGTMQGLGPVLVAAFEGLGFQGLWWVFGSIVAISLSSLDTYVVSFVQHTKMASGKIGRKILLGDVRFLFMLATLAAVLVSFAVTSKVHWMLGSIVSSILIANFLVLLRVFGVVEIHSSEPMLKAYYALVSVGNSIFWIWAWDQMDQVIHLVVIMHLLVALVVVLWSVRGVVGRED